MWTGDGSDREGCGRNPRIVGTAGQTAPVHPPTTAGTPMNLDALTSAELARDFDPRTWDRGARYAGEGRVRDLTVSPGAREVTMTGTVRGTRSYRVIVTLVEDRDGIGVEGDCECPVGWNCKHAVAVLLEAVAPAPALPPSSVPRVPPTRTSPAAVPPTPYLYAPPSAPPPPTWEQVLDAALSAAPRPDAREPLPLALQVEVRAPDPALASQVFPLPPTLLVRPLKRGAKQNWIKSGAGWNDVPTLQHSGRHDREQVAVLAAIRQLRAVAAYYARAADGVDLADLGASVWPLLRQAQELGLPLVTVPPLHEVHLLDGAALDLDVRETDDATQVEAVLRGHPRPPGSRLRVMGEPGHGVLLLEPVEAGKGRWTAHVGPLAGAVDPVVRRLVDRAEPVQVPAEARERFESTYLPALRRSSALVSSDESVRIPDLPVPRAVATVTWRAADRVGLSWRWRYAVGDRVHECGLGSDDDLDGVRDLAAERALLRDVATDEHGRRLLRSPGGVLLPDVLLGTGDVLTFVRHLLPALEAAEGVLVEEHGDRPDYREAVSDPQISFEVVPAGEGEDAETTDWLDLHVVIDVDGEQLPLADVLEALTLEHEVVFLPSGRYVRTDHPALARLAEAVRAAGEVTRGGNGRLRVASYDYGTWGELAELGIVDEQAAQWVRSAKVLTDLTELPEVEPTGLTSQLRPYQLDGFRWLAFLWESGLGGVLADDMGLGKTLQTLALIAHATGRGSGPFLVVAPTSVVPGWVSEAARHTPGLRVRAVEGTAKRRGTTIAEEVDGVDVLVTSYTLLRLEGEDYTKVDWGGLVLDEAHQVKNHRGQTYKAVRMLDAPFRLGLTGTPFENRLMELWSLLSIVTPGLYPWPQQFQDQVVGPVEKRGDENALARFRRRIRPFLLRRTKSLVAADLPPKQEQVLDVTLAPKHRRIYDTHLQRERQEVLGLVDDFERNRIAIFGALTRLRQLSLDAALVDPAQDAVGSAKLDVLVEHLHELAAEGHRALVFSQFTGYLGRVRDRLAREGIGAAYLDGSTRDRGAVIEDFRRGDAPVFLISLKAGGVGLTLTEADYVFVLDPWWNPAVEAQAVDRAHRIGQQKPVMVYRLVATDTIEEKVMELKARKAELFSQVVDGDGALSGAVTAEDVKALFEA